MEVESSHEVNAARGWCSASSDWPRAAPEPAVGGAAGRRDRRPREPALPERGGVYATAHARCGGDYGKRWWQAGPKLNKPHTWRDPIDCCEHLVKPVWASRKTLTIQDESTGGTTVGMACTAG